MIYFFHANSIPSRAYRQFHALLSQASAQEISAPDNLSKELAELSGPMHWPVMQGRVTDWLERSFESGRGQAMQIVGHSMGGYLCLPAALGLLRQGRVTADKLKIVLIDSPIVVGWRSRVFRAIQAFGGSYRVGPAPGAVRRRDRWSSREEAREFFAGKAFVKAFAPGVLDDYLAAILCEHPDGGVTLSVPKKTEAHIYANLETRKASRALLALRKQGVSIKFIAGTRSEEMRMAGRENNERIFGQHLHSLEAGHHIPLEVPAECARLVARLLALPPPSER